MHITHPDIENYAREHTTPENETLRKNNRETYAKILRPRMLSGHLQGRLLEMISKMVQPSRILEIGTYTGYSAICLSRGMKDNGILHTIDHNPELEDFTRNFFRMEGLEDKVIYHLGEALDILPGIEEIFDLVFIDADKENYIRYYEICMEKLNPGGVILADNVLWDGKVLDITQNNDEETIAIDRFNNHVQNDIRV